MRYECENLLKGYRIFFHAEDFDLSSLILYETMVKRYMRTVPSCTVSVLALELYFKSILTMEGTEFKRIHSLIKLHNLLTDSSKAKLEEYLQNSFKDNKFLFAATPNALPIFNGTATLMDILVDADESFVYLRYMYDYEYFTRHYQAVWHVNYAIRQVASDIFNSSKEIHGCSTGIGGKLDGRVREHILSSANG
jgi:hypothetical protein